MPCIPMVALSFLLKFFQKVARAVVNFWKKCQIFILTDVSMGKVICFTPKKF